MQFIIQKMNNELEWQRMLEWPQHQNTYLIHIITNQQQISIQVQDKFCGDIWHSIFSCNGIQELTAKARNPKKYAVFTKMLVSALTNSSESLTAEILSYREMNNKFGKPGSQSKMITPQQASKRFLLLTYVGQFQKMQFPLPLMHYSDIPSERLKLTIKRMSQQLQLLREGHSQDEIAKENSLLKYENESLKNKLKGHSLNRSEARLDMSANLQPKIEELEKELGQKQSYIVNLQQKLSEQQKLRKDLEAELKKSEENVEKLEQKIGEFQSQNTDKLKAKKKMAHYQQKIQELIQQMNEISTELVFFRQKDKKSELKISTLQKELQKMIKNKRNNPKNTNYRDSSPEDKKSEKALSIKSGRSNTSQKSLNKTRNLNNKNIVSNYGQYSHLNTSNSKKLSNKKKTSVFDSDTESSRLRRMANSRSSPYRQSAAVNTNRSKRPTNQRSRSKSRDIGNSPRSSAPMESQMMTDGYQSGDSSEEDSNYDKIEGYLKDLKERKGARKTVKQSTSTHTQNSGSKIQRRLQTLEEMIRKTAKATKVRQ